jgi:hypothetical protein
MYGREMERIATAVREIASLLLAGVVILSTAYYKMIV